MSVAARLAQEIRDPGFHQRFFLVVIATALLDVLFWVFDVFSRSVAVQTVYCFGISISTFLLIDLGRNLWPDYSGRDYWPRGWRLAVHYVVGVAAGYLIGTSLGIWAAHIAGVDPLPPGTRQGTTLFMSLTIASGFIYFFYQRSRVEELSRQASEAQLLLLQSQLEPHMLFNTLANLRALITSDTARALALLDHLNGYLRATLGASRAGTHALAREFDLLRNYLEIMALRMGDRLHYRLDIGAGLENQAFPALLLQPLVENSIRHGLEPKADGGTIDVAASRSGNDLIVEVRDTGIGFQATQLNPGSPTERFGLSHVRERLQTRYGARGTLQLSTPSVDSGGGALVRVVLPASE